jgi:predicted benzoate:H+ symporter BenE
MLRISSIAVAVYFVAASAPQAAAMPAALVDGRAVSQVELVQEKPKKSETVTQKVKRVWRNVTTPNHNFCVACPVLLPLSRTTCTAQAKTVDEARGKCASQYPLCSVTESKKGC